MYADMLAGLLVLQFALSSVGSTRPSREYSLRDRFAPEDVNNPFPNHFCDLNDDEYGRPFNGPFDEYQAPGRLIPSLPTPKGHYNFSRIRINQQTTELFAIRVTTEELNLYCGDLLTSPDECGAKKEACTGDGTQYDSCGKRCSCNNGVLENCCRVRKDWRSLPQADKKAYIQAILDASNIEQYRSCFNALVNMHAAVSNKGIHGPDSYFLPWHRWYILSLENLLRRINCRITVPYWDWSLEADNWKNSVIWSEDYGFGGNGNRKNDYIVETPPFGAEYWTPPNRLPLKRKFRNGRLIQNAARVAFIQRYTVEQYNDWYNSTQDELHNSVHCAIGGTMCTAASPNDPIFFLHHGFIDKLWADWQYKGIEYLELPIYSKNNTEMPGGATPSEVYNLLNQPGCVKVCIQNPVTPMASLAYSPICSRDMNTEEYSLIKLLRLMNRPLLPPSEKSFKLFHTSPAEVVIAKAKIALTNNYKQLVDIMRESDYSTNQPKIYQPRNVRMDLVKYVYRSLAFDGSNHKCSSRDHDL